MKNQNGYTMVETIIVLGILAILALWATPTMMSKSNKDDAEKSHAKLALYEKYGSHDQSYINHVEKIKLVCEQASDPENCLYARVPAYASWINHPSHGGE